MQLVDIDLLELPGKSNERKLPALTLTEIENAKQYGILKPVIVTETQNKEVHKANQKYTMLAEIQTWLLAQKIGKRKVPVHIVDIGVESELEIMKNFSRTVQVDNQNPIEEANRLKEMMELMEIKSITELAKICGSTRTNISHKMRLLKLSPYVKQLLIESKISEGQARPLVTLDQLDQRILANEIVRKKMNVREIENRRNSLKGEGEEYDIKNVQSLMSRPETDKINTSSLEKLLSDKLGCNVSLQNGKLVIDYYSNVDILEGILEGMGVDKL